MTQPYDKHLDEDRDEVAADVAAFLASGGTIEQIPIGKSKHDYHPFRVFICASCGGSKNRVPQRNICRRCYNLQTNARRRKP